MKLAVANPFVWGKIKIVKSEESQIMSNRENFQIQIHSRLNEQNVKLWLEPYFKDNEANQEEIQVRFY